MCRNLWQVGLVRNIQYKTQGIAGSKHDPDKGSFPCGPDSRVCLHCGRPGFNPWVGKIPWKRKWQLTPVFLPRESHGQSSLAGYIPWGGKRVRHNLVAKQHQFSSKGHVSQFSGRAKSLKCCFSQNCKAVRTLSTGSAAGCWGAFSWIRFCVPLLLVSPSYKGPCLVCFQAKKTRIIQRCNR